MKKHIIPGVFFFALFLFANSINGQELNADSVWKHTRKNTIRYNFTSAIIFGVDKSIIFGYERLLSPHRSISVNGGTIALPKLISIETDSFSLQKKSTNNGVNFSLDYRFYLAKLNKYPAPRGIYIGPWLSYNSFTRENDWDHKNSSSQRTARTETKMNIFSLGAEMGYQFLFWKRLAVDFVMIGPGFGVYRIKAKYDSGLTDAQKEQLRQALSDIISQKFPGMDIAIGDKELDANGKLNVTSFGYRYVIHIGYNF
jgi:hypothetical protein